MNICSVCGEPYPSHAPDGHQYRVTKRYCSERCRQDAEREPLAPHTHCQTCGEPLPEGHHPAQRFCNRKCTAKAYRAVRKAETYGGVRDISPEAIEMRFQAARVVVRRASHVEVGFDYMARVFPWL